VDTPIAYAAVTHEMGSGETHAEWRAFGLFYHDDRGLIKTDNRPTAARSLDLQPIDIGTYGGHFIAAVPGPGGTFDLLGWGALQTGRWGTLTQRSAAGSAELGFQPHIAASVRPWIRGGYFIPVVTGTPRTIRTARFLRCCQPARLRSFSVFNEMNNRDLFAELILRPSKNLVLRTDVHGLWLADSHDLWYTGGGAFQPWTFGFSGRPSNGSTGLANLYDMSADYKFTHGVTLGLYFGYAQGREVIEKSIRQQ